MKKVVTKRVSVRIDYVNDTKSGSKSDLTTFKCPYKKYIISMTRDEIGNHTILNKIADNECDLIAHKYRTTQDSIEFSIKVDFLDYVYLFGEQIYYSEDRRNSDLVKMFTQLKLKIIEVYHDVDAYKKYLDNVDYSGEIDGCTYCKYWHKNQYCTKFNIVEQPKNCIFYKFKSNN